MITTFVSKQRCYVSSMLLSTFYKLVCCWSMNSELLGSVTVTLKDNPYLICSQHLRGSSQPSFSSQPDTLPKNQWMLFLGQCTQGNNCWQLLLVGHYIVYDGSEKKAVPCLIHVWDDHCLGFLCLLILWHGPKEFDSEINFHEVSMLQIRNLWTMRFFFIYGIKMNRSIARQIFAFKETA